MIGQLETANDYEYIVAIGTSTGGPKALADVISQLDKHLPATFVVVQHMPQGFTKSLADRLNTLTELTVKEAEHREVLKKGYIYIAPGGKQFKVANGRRPEVQLTDDLPYKGHKPSVNVMLQSLSELGNHKKMLVVIMTGMGNDGLEGVQVLKHKRPNLKVVVQNENTCVVYGMPKAIVTAGEADYIVPVEQIPQTIKKLMGE